MRSSCREFEILSRSSRRAALQAGALGVLGLTLPRLAAGRSVERTARAGGSAELPGFGRAKRCLFIFVWGGPSQLDTWDPKPDAPREIRGEFQPIDTAVPGIRISEHFPRLARHTDKLAIVRSLTHDDPAHLSSVHHLTTGWLAPTPKSDAVPPSRKDSPHVGSVLTRLGELRGTTAPPGADPRPAASALPPFVMMPWSVSHPAAPGGTAPGQHAGWLGAAYDPFLVTGDPNSPRFEVSGLALPRGMSSPRLDRRRALLGALDAGDLGGNGFGALQQSAFDLLLAPEVRAAFDLRAEPRETRARYGRNIHGQCLLLGRRLLEAGVPLVCVNWHQDGKNFWDTHGSNFKRLRADLMPPADQGLAALLEDLSASGLLDETLIVWAGEFGRAPHINGSDAGRDHWPYCFSAVLAGGGVQGGRIYGASDKHAAYPASQPVSPADLTSTIYHALGIPAETLLYDRENRPHALTQGQPLDALFV